VDLSAFTPAHLALIVGVLVALDWVFKRIKMTWETGKQFVNGVLDERLPASIKATLSNGGGDIIRGIVRAENDRQSQSHRDEMSRIVTEAIRAHEAIEEARVAKALAEFKNEITGEFALKKRR
jgi:hypothetical protein